MSIPEDGVLLRVFLGESDRWHGRPLYEAIVLKARELHLAGATVLRLSEDLPVVIEIVDSREKIDELLPHIDEMVREGLVTLENVRVIQYRADKPSP
jgi:PII-like signaling protein